MHKEHVYNLYDSYVCIHACIINNTCMKLCLFCNICTYMFHLKALLPMCMKHTARGESQVTDIAEGEAECCICYETFTKSCILSYKRSGSTSSVLLYFTLMDVLTEDTPLKFNTFFY